MEKIPKVVIIGAGNIGSEVYKRVKELEWIVSAVVDVDGVFKELPKNEKIGNVEDYPKYLLGTDLAFLTISTFDDGKIAYSYIKNCLEAGVPVVTCEKGALSNYYSELEEGVKKGFIGFNATVGGGTRVLRYARERVGNNTKCVHAILNGTLNFIFESLSDGYGLNEIVEKAQKLGYAEPGASNPLEIINKEAMSDVKMKAVILFNACNLGNEKIRAKDVAVRPINSFELETLVEQAKNRRYIVSIGSAPLQEDIIGGFNHKAGKWFIDAGFRCLDENLIYKDLVSREAGNAFHIYESYDCCNGESNSGNYLLKGPGAGAGPTAHSMILDAKEILELKFENS